MLSAAHKFLLPDTTFTMKIFNCALGLALVATAAAAGPSGTLSLVMTDSGF